MRDLSRVETFFVAWAFFFQVVLIVHFALRKWAFEAYVRPYGWLVYALGVGGLVLAILLMRDGQPWWIWLGGVLQFVWSVYGLWIEYARGIEWRNPPRWSIMGSYLTLYLSTIMFYWWPLARLWRPLWYVYAVLFVIATVLNLVSHGPH
ncbi:MAG: hypothetical protein J7M15_06405 [Anaerolineae bacterium]|nr:hypothetical protein [Anaerolineae bacterium]